MENNSDKFMIAALEQAHKKNPNEPFWVVAGKAGLMRLVRSREYVGRAKKEGEVGVGIEK